MLVTVLTETFTQCILRRLLLPLFLINGLFNTYVFLAPKHKQNSKWIDFIQPCHADATHGASECAPKFDISFTCVSRWLCKCGTAFQKLQHSFVNACSYLRMCSTNSWQGAIWANVLVNTECSVNWTSALRKNCSGSHVLETAWWQSCNKSHMLFYDFEWTISGVQMISETIPRHNK